MRHPENSRRKKKIKSGTSEVVLLTLLALVGWLAVREPQPAPPQPAPPPAQAPSIPATPPPAVRETSPEPSPAAPEIRAAEGCPRGCEAPSPGCAIKGNISTKHGGERIYHVPGQRWYGRTKIDPAAGERWFCTEDEAVANGWRRAKV